MITKLQLQDYAKTIKEHPAHDEIMARVQRNLFNRWIAIKTDDDVGLKTIKMISDSQRLFLMELNVVIESIDEDEPVNQTNEDS